MTKRIISIVMVAVLLVTFSFSTYAVSQKNIYEIDGHTIIFAQDNALDESTKEHIANYLVYGENDVQTYGLMCTLFGHKYESSTVDVITHCVSASNPRCLMETYGVQTCTRCDDSTSELLGYTYITCCPEE